MICKVPCYQQELLVQGIFLLNDILLDVRSNCHKNFITLQSVVVFFLTSQGCEETMETGRELGFTENDIGVLRKASNDLKTLRSIILISKICDLSHQKGIMAKKQL